MALVVRGLMNKRVGVELGISEITVKAHRSRVMQKMRANSFADLVKMAMTMPLTAHQNGLRDTFDRDLHCVIRFSESRAEPRSI